MIFNTGDIVRIDGHFKRNLNGKEGELIRVDYEKEVSLFDDGKLVCWIRNDFLTKVREFYERNTNNMLPFYLGDAGHQVHKVFR